MLADVFENWKTERDDLFEWAAGTGLFVHRPEHLVNAALEEFVFVSEVRVEGGSANVRAMEDLFHRDGAVRLFAGKPDQRVSQR